MQNPFSRPVYETDDDKDRQARAAARIEDAWGIKIISFPPLSSVDWLMISEKGTVAYAEFKCRKYKRSDFKNLILSTQKLKHAVYVGARTKCKLFLFVEWLDGIFYREITPDQFNGFSVKTGGRDDREDPKDIEDVFEIPTNSFKSFYS